MRLAVLTLALALTPSGCGTPGVVGGGPMHQQQNGSGQMVDELAELFASFPFPVESLERLVKSPLTRHDSEDNSGFYYAFSVLFRIYLRCDRALREKTVGMWLSSVSFEAIQVAKNVCRSPEDLARVLESRD
jgi:hypothetical protein